MLYLNIGWLVGGAHINSYTFEGQTALWIAADNNSLEAARVLLEAGGLVNLPNNEDVTPMHCGKLEIITNFLRKQNLQMLLCLL